MSKQFTAAAVGMLILDGKLSLDDDVRKYIKELPSYDHPILLRDLIYHTSGLRDYISLAEDLSDYAATRSLDLATTSSSSERMARLRASFWERTRGVFGTWR